MPLANGLECGLEILWAEVHDRCPVAAVFVLDSELNSAVCRRLIYIHIYIYIRAIRRLASRNHENERAVR